MSIGLPSHIAPRAVSTALSHAANGMAGAVLICGVVVGLGFAAAYPERTLWPCVVALALMVPMILIVRRSRRVWPGVVYLAVGAFATYTYTATLALAIPEVIESSVIWLSPPKIALLLAAGSGVGLTRALIWLCAGYGVAEASAFLALEQAGVSPVLDLLTLAIFVEGVAVCLLAFVSVRSAVRATPRLQRAAREELLDDMRARMELRAAALMHDTILSHLAAIASSSDSTLTGEQKQQIERDLQILVGQEWLNSPADVADDDSAADRVSPLHAAIAEVRAQGLEVSGTGDFASVRRLSAEQANALGLAAKQCLVNVVRHSGVMKAEVAVYSSEEEVSVMVIDAGRGFSDSSVGADRLGLRASVQSRIQSVGGVVQVWSTPGAGTSILMQFPVGGHGARLSDSDGQSVVSGPLPTITSGDTDEGSLP